MTRKNKSFQPRWAEWEKLIVEAGISIDRPRNSIHPDRPEIRYPIDYGFVNGTLGTDGNELDIFVGSEETGLVGAILTTDRIKKDRECKLLYNCSPEEVYLINGFINFDREKMWGALVMRVEMSDLWKKVLPADR